MYVSKMMEETSGKDGFEHYTGTGRISPSLPRGELKQSGFEFHTGNAPPSPQQNTYMMQSSTGKCDFDLFRRTPFYAEGIWTIPGHEHPLVMKDPRLVYNSVGFWRCDLCGASCTGPVAHCSLCQFDACSTCLGQGLQPS